MQKLISEFEAMCADRPVQIIDAKLGGACVVEYTGVYVPEEIIYAAGAVGYPMWRGGEPEPPEKVLDESVKFLNPLVRTQVGSIKLGLDPVAPIADIYAQSITDSHVSRMCELAEREGYPVCKVSVPADWTTPEDYEYYKNRVIRFRERVEKAAGVTITDEKLAEAIKVYNRIRTLLKSISDLRLEDNPPISGSEFARINHCAVLCDPTVAIEYLEKILAAAPQAERPKGRRKRVVLVGHAVAVNDYYVLRSFEAAGADVVFELHDECLFDYEHLVSEEGDPFDAIIQQRYRSHIPNTNMQPSWELRRAAMMDAYERFRADGIVVYDLLYDEIYDMEYAVTADYLGKRGIPLVRLQSAYEYTREAMGPLNTRVETFVASLQGGKR